MFYDSLSCSSAPHYQWVYVAMEIAVIFNHRVPSWMEVGNEVRPLGEEKQMHKDCAQCAYTYDVTNCRLVLVANETLLRTTNGISYTTTGFYLRNCRKEDKANKGYRQAPGVPFKGFHWIMDTLR